MINVLKTVMVKVDSMQKQMGDVNRGLEILSVRSESLKKPDRRSELRGRVY